MHLSIAASAFLTFFIRSAAQPPLQSAFPSYSFDYGPQGFRPSPPPLDYGPGPFSGPPGHPQSQGPFREGYMDHEHPRPRPISRGEIRRPDSFDSTEPRGPMESFDGPDFRDRQRYTDATDPIDPRRSRAGLSDRVETPDRGSFGGFRPDNSERFRRPRRGIRLRNSRDSLDRRVPNARIQYSSDRNFGRDHRVHDRSPIDHRRFQPRRPYDIRRQLLSEPSHSRNPRRFRTQVYRQQESASRLPNSDRFRRPHHRTRSTRRPGTHGPVRESSEVYREPVINFRDSPGTIRDSSRAIQDYGEAVRDSDGAMRDSRGAFRYNPGRIVVDRKHTVERSGILRRPEESRRQIRRGPENRRIFGRLSKQIIPRQSERSIRYSTLLRQNRPNTDQSKVNVIVRNPALDQNMGDRKTTKSVRLAKDPFVSNRSNRMRERGLRPGTTRVVTRSGGNFINRGPVSKRSQSNLLNDKPKSANVQQHTPIPRRPFQQDSRQIGETVVDLRPSVLIRSPKITRSSDHHHGHIDRHSGKPSHGQKSKIVDKISLAKNITKTGSKDTLSDSLASNTVVKIKHRPTNSGEDLPKVVFQSKDTKNKAKSENLKPYPKSQPSHFVAKADSLSRKKAILEKTNIVSALKENMKNPKHEKIRKGQKPKSKPRVVEQRGLDVIARDITQKAANKPKESQIPTSHGSNSLLQSGPKNEIARRKKLSKPIPTSPFVDINAEIDTQRPKLKDMKPEVPSLKKPIIKIVTTTNTPLNKQEVEPEKYLEKVTPSQQKVNLKQLSRTQGQSSQNFEIIVLNMKNSSIPADVRKLVPEGTSPEIIRALSRVLKESPAQQGVQGLFRPHVFKSPEKIVTKPKIIVTKAPVQITTTTKAPLDIKELISLIKENKSAQAMKLMSRKDLSAFMPQTNRQSGRRQFSSPQTNTHTSNNMYNKFGFQSNPYSSGLFGDNLFSGIMANKFFEGGLMEGLF